MTTIELLIEQARATNDQNGWFVTVSNSLRGLTAAQAVWKAPGLDHSICETLAHLNYYNERHLKRLTGQPREAKAAGNDETFQCASNLLEEAWQEEAQRFADIMTNWCRYLEQRSVDAATDASAGADSSWMSVIAHINLHNAYHGGQIVLIRKLQGSWNAADGVS